MKKRTINRWIRRCFIAILVLSIAASAAVNLYEAYRDTMQLRLEWAKVCANNMTYLLHYHWSLEELDESAESEKFLNARKTLRNICKNFQLDYVYLYSIDPETPSRYYYVSASLEEESDRILGAQYARTAVTAIELLPGEEALLGGAEDIQWMVVHNQFGDELTYMAPYRDRDGALRAVIGMDYSLSRLRQKILDSFLADILPFLLSLTVGFLILLVLVRRRIVKPLHALSDSMTQFSRDSRKKPEPLHIPPRDEIGEIAATYEKMTADISAYIQNIEALTRKQTETDVQLDIAQHIQYGQVPGKTSLNGEGFRISTMTQPAKAVGGDFYDCFQRDDGGVCIVMGDVSGKGISAAIFMAMTKTMIREKLKAGLTPAEALNQVNNALCVQNPEGLFVTAFAAVMNPFTGEVRYANAGHTYPILLGKTPAVLEPENGVALGLFDDERFTDDSIRLASSEGILLYTDGVTDAVNPQNVFFGIDRLLDALKGVAETADAEETILRISRTINAFCDGSEPFDDMAALALIRTASDKGWQPLTVAVSSFDEIKKTVFAAVGETPEARRALLACDEALTNIVRYSGAKALMFSCQKQGEELLVSFLDDGIPFDPTAVQAEEKDFDLLDSGGMGLNLIRQSVSSMRYRRKDQWNEFSLSFRLDRPDLSDPQSNEAPVSSKTSFSMKGIPCVTNSHL